MATTTITEQITEAYDRIARRGDLIRLADLRNELGETVNRHDLDDALRVMNRTGEVDLSPMSTQGDLTDHDHWSAVRVGSLMTHLISIR
ncbi:hypothetical protein [Micromonospora wenchangensis]|uniref:hypothetical protein n=1 Tax=Micromonospora wenchangensis TaxID=1185415 RepID=UPI003817E9FE